MSAEQDTVHANGCVYSAEKADSSWVKQTLLTTPGEVLSDVLTSPWEKTVLDLYYEGGLTVDMMLQNSVTKNYERLLQGIRTKHRS